MNDGLGIEIHSTAEEFPSIVPFATVAVASIYRRVKARAPGIRTPLLASDLEYCRLVCCTDT